MEHISIKAQSENWFSREAEFCIHLGVQFYFSILEQTRSCGDDKVETVTITKIGFPFITSVSGLITLIIVLIFLPLPLSGYSSTEEDEICQDLSVT